MKYSRIFFAIEPQESLLEILNDILNHLNKNPLIEQEIKWVPLNNLHVTLAFIGTIQREHIPTLIKNVKHHIKCVEPFYLELGNLMLFPAGNCPKVISLQAGPNSTLVQVTDHINQGILATHYPIETRPFRGHMTLARLNNYKPDVSSLAQIEIAKIPRFLINEITLFESKSAAGTSHYQPLTRFILT
ncbi:MULTISPECIES: RNA 2',3'-cyclic phosphodiesterase [unclassified Legionella]|uniref:RNA 2',3'-cyclic phosphodiesterase n=1 Tax=unclassified Legionella TaxID=2622702 RepID=UPI001056542F|nr:MULTISPECIES: RNA 2',3'-cyclic phosphodiesterase [unclassified Legionella]MDI9817931.1 RNA 2',3'-cyclic phosphodiesterase [Legionella sp. PL877]